MISKRQIRISLISKYQISFILYIRYLYTFSLITIHELLRWIWFKIRVRVILIQIDSLLFHGVIKVYFVRFVIIFNSEDLRVDSVIAWTMWSVVRVYTNHISLWIHYYMIHISSKIVPFMWCIILTNTITHVTSPSIMNSFLKFLLMLNFLTNSFQ